MVESWSDRFDYCIPFHIERVNENDRIRKIPYTKQRLLDVIRSLSVFDEFTREKTEKKYAWNQSVYCFFLSVSLCLTGLLLCLNVFRNGLSTSTSQSKEMHNKDRTTIKIVHHQFEINKKKQIEKGIKRPESSEW